MTNLSPQTKNLVGILTLAVMAFLASVIFSVIPSSSATSNKILIYFYSSESNINNYKSLKMEFDRYLSRYGPYEFQPFKDRETFEQQIKDKERCLLLLSSWHFKNIYKDYDLTFALTGLRNGNKYQQRILVALDTVLSIDDLIGADIASASSVEHTMSVVSGMFKKKDATLKESVLDVPTDINALYCVVNGTSKAALITRNTFEEVEKIYPSMYRKMKILAEGRESLSLIVAIPEGFVEQAVQPIDIMKNMPTNPDGKKNMRMLGLDGWQEPDLSDRRTLETR